MCAELFANNTVSGYSNPHGDTIVLPEHVGWNIETRLAGQRVDELSFMVDFMKEHKVKTFLEIGSRCGTIARYIWQETGAKITCVDLPGGAWGNEKYLPALKANVQKAGGRLVLGDSTSPEVIGKIYGNTYDFIFIDGDHSEEGVRADWKNYGMLGKYVGFHDIAGTHYSTKNDKTVEVHKLWDELRVEYDTVEHVGPGSRMGIGIVTL